MKGLGDIFDFLKGTHAPKEAEPARQKWLRGLSAVDAIIASGYFDRRHYCEVSGAQGTGRALVEHYLEVGVHKGWSTTPQFEPAYYLTMYPDIAESGTDPLLHFVKVGQFEGRCPSMLRARTEVEIIRRSGQFDSYAYEMSRLNSGLTHPSGGLESDILEYVVYGALRGQLPKSDFEHDFFKLYYEYLIGGRLSPFAFYCRYAGTPWCVPNPFYLAEEAELVAASPFFDREWYRKTYLADRPSVDEVVHYCTEGFAVGADPSADFRSAYYLRKYHDILDAQITPLGHYTRHGQSEGRLCALPDEFEIADGVRSFDPSLPTVLIVSHEASRTGAPIVALGLVQAISQWANVVAWVGADGPLMGSFETDSVAVIRKLGDEADNAIVVDRLIERFDLRFAILNSVVSSRAAAPLRLRAIPVVSLIHEFAEYVRPRGWASSMVINSSITVLPAQLVRDSLLHEFDELRLPVLEPNIVLRHQGRYDLRTMTTSDERKPRSLTPEQVLLRAGIRPGQEKPIIVLGAGWVQPRKGVDLFVETARNFKQKSNRPVKFIWVGGNYNPDKDMVYSVFISDQISRSGLSDDIYFFGEQPDLDAFWAVSDVFFMSSRLDPFPNVVLDAVAEQVATVCFDQTTGCVELARPASRAITIVPYNDCAAAAQAIVELGCDRDAVKAELRMERDYWAERFSTERYARDVFELGERAAAETRGLADAAAALQDSGDFDPSYASFGSPRWSEPPMPDMFIAADTAAANLVNAAISGFHFVRPAPGRSYDPQAAATVLDGSVHFLPAIPVPAPTDGPVPPDDGGAALHLHIAGEAPLDFLTQVAERPGATRLVITTADEAVAEALVPLVEALPDRVVVESDEGFRDPVVAYLTILRSTLADCTLVGSLPLLSPTEESRSFGKQLHPAMRLFMTDPAIVEPVFRMFEEAPELALCFAEQPRVVGSPTMRRVAGELADAAGIDLAGLGEVSVPLDLACWVRPRLLPVLRSDALFDRVTAIAPRTTPILHIDGFARFLVGCCRAANLESRAVYAPTVFNRLARPSYTRPPIPVR